jgi:hypothetical protein
MKKSSRLFAVVIVLVIAGTHFGAESAAEPQARAGKPAPKPLYTDPVFGHPTDPVLCFNAEQNKWFMFYTSRRGRGIPLIHGTRIGIAASEDEGATWTYLQNAEIDYTKGLDEYTYWAPEVIWHGGTYHMYLSFVPGIFDNWDHPREIIHLTSKDLIKWEFQSVLDLGSDRVIDACVIQLPDGSWRMWYKDERKEFALSYADSPDLYKWQTKGNAVTDHNGEGPKVVRWKGQYWLIADIWSGQAVWTSDDCENWTLRENRLPGNHGDVVVSNDRAFFFFFGNRGLGRRSGPRERGVSINVVELEAKDNELVYDAEEVTYIQLLPERELER